MKRVMLFVVCLLLTGGVVIANPSDVVTEPTEQVAAAVEVAAEPAVVETAAEPLSSTEQPLEAANSCPLNSPSCSPFNLEPCDDYCGEGFGVCYRFCCVCAG